ncbi:MAG TPA: bifunctional phosphoribosylaminoimidazolecarboxamide formyltransferase/IMP cyclohydrolase [Pyrinomonadaceae bacterium]|nr:bifunctional phosphoribosylaminoimidazolecarboxamide formyltransferase/IMP cyclohydrolase [Pyrinomonadaceae bacterium]
MTQQNEQGLHRIRRVLISVSDKSGVVEFARELERFGVELISTGGTAKVLRDAGIATIDISDVTGFPEMMDGRIKTLHPRVHGGLLALRDNPEHLSAMSEHDIRPLDMVVINLYPFEKTIMQDGVSLDEAVEQIDIGGPAMIRSAGKNWRHVAVIIEPESYSMVLEELRASAGALSLATRRALAQRAFKRTADYDSAIHGFLSAGSVSKLEGFEERHTRLPEQAHLSLKKILDLRYGENPHQQAALYDYGAEPGIAKGEVLSGKEMSFNNYVDADAAWQLASDFRETACAIIKHTNPAGVGIGSSSEEAYRKALATDPVSAFGGIVAFNQSVDPDTARALIEIFIEVVVAPDYDIAALEVLRTKKNLRVLKAPRLASSSEVEYRQISGGMLIQTRDTHQLTPATLETVTRRKPSEEELQALLFAWTVCKHTKSNAIVYARKDQTIGVGAGQMSRVDSVKIGAMRAQLPLEGSVLASDAFFPFRDGIDEAAKHGITAVIQPGGSVRDSEVIAAADEHDLAMVFTGIRHFKH